MNSAKARPAPQVMVAADGACRTIAITDGKRSPDHIGVRPGEADRDRD